MYAVETAESVREAPSTPPPPMADGWTMRFSRSTGAPYYVHTSGKTQWDVPVLGEQQPMTPPPPGSPEFHPDAIPEDDVIQRFPQQVAPRQSIEEAYRQAALISAMAERDASTTIQLRRACNFVKDGPIRACLSMICHVMRVSEVAVVDLCCGRGGDFDKFRRACRDSGGRLAHLVGADVAGGEALVESRRRWTSVAKDSAPATLRGGVVRADLANDNTARMVDDACERERFPDDAMPGPQKFHMVSCMFAMHYFFRDEASFRRLAAGAAYYVKEGGFFAMIHADGEAIARAHFDRPLHERANPALQIGMATLTLHANTMQMLNDPSPDVGERPFGWGYDFYLPEAVNNVTEFIVHTPTRDRILHEYNFIPVIDENAASVIRSMRRVDFWEDAFLKSDVACDGSGSLGRRTMDHLSLYRVSVFVHSPLQLDVHKARDWLRRTLGLDA